MRFFTSDTHFGHQRIIELCNRPFRDVDHMNIEIVDEWNKTVTAPDVVYHLGDVALGQIDQSLPIVSRLNGYRILVNGNHDRPFMNRGKARYDEWHDRYSEVFHDVFHTTAVPLVLTEGTEVLLSHFPYDGDSHGDDRYREDRPVDEGIPLIHGHTHGKETLTYSAKGTPQIHVGMDAWGFSPVSEDIILDILKNA